MTNEMCLPFLPVRGARGVLCNSSVHTPCPSQGGNIESAPRKLSFILLTALLIVSFPAFVFAWGQIGHRTVAMLAEQHLTPKARQELSKLLQPGETLASISTYADEIRNTRPDTRRLHFVNISLMANSYLPSRDCRSSDEGDCIIAALERFRIELANVKETRERRTFALKFIVHLIGDLHQPLHCGDNDDRGGNDVKVTWFGPNERQQNLHGVWDYAIIEQGGRKEADWLKILSQVSPEKIPTLQTGSVTQWAMESWQAAKDHAYKIPPNHQLGQAYYDKSLPVVEDRLRKAGLRLARVLNEALQ